MFIADDQKCPFLKFFMVEQFKAESEVETRQNPNYPKGVHFQGNKK